MRGYLTLSREPLIGLKLYIIFQDDSMDDCIKTTDKNGSTVYVTRDEVMADDLKRLDLSYFTSNHQTVVCTIFLFSPTRWCRALMSDSKSSQAFNLKALTFKTMV